MCDDGYVFCGILFHSYGVSLKITGQGDGGAVDGRGEMSPAGRVARRGFSSSAALPKRKWDAVIVGGGHNGLTSAAYLARAGLEVAVLEKRHVIGGAAVTEEIVPGFRFSRCSYLQSLLRPALIR